MLQLSRFLLVLELLSIFDYISSFSITKKNKVLVISFDGMRSSKFDEFLSDNPNSAFNSEFIKSGVKAEYMIPSFPTLTFPNHYTLVTGILH